MMWGYYSSWGGSLIMILSMVVWVALLAALIVLVVRRLGPQSSARMDSTQPRSAIEILEQRYARGEIDETTFKRMRDELRADPLHAAPTV